MDGEVSPGARVAWRIDAGLWRDAQQRDGRWLVDAAIEDVPGGPHVVSVKAVDVASGVQGETTQFHVRVLSPKARDAAIQTSAPGASPREVDGGAAVLALAAAALAAALLPRARRR